jgi:4-carboxymuconolactone decarboxylase
MNRSNESLGGRIPLFDSRALTPAQKAVYSTIDTKMVPWAEAAGFKAKLADGKLIGPFNTILASPEIAASFLALQGSEEEHTSLSKRVRQVVILSVGAVYQADYERYAHSAVAEKAGLSQDAIRALSQGDEAEDLSPQERVAQRFTKQLTAEHQIDDPLYREAVDAFGVAGIVDIVFLAGCYYVVSSLLNAFRVPVPE